MFSSFDLLVANLTVTLTMFHILAALFYHFPCFYFPCGQNFSACSSNHLRLSSLEFQPLLHHGRTMATVLLEPLLAPAAATSAADLHRRRHHPSFHKPPLIQPHRHIWSTYPCSSHSPDSPHATVHTTTTAHAVTTDSTITAKVPAATTSATAHNSSSHSTRHIFQTQSTARSWRWPGSAPPPPPHHPTSHPPSHPSKTLGTKLTTIGTPILFTAASSIEQYNLPNGHGRPVLPASQLLTFFPGNSHTTAPPSIQHAP